MDTSLIEPLLGGIVSTLQDLIASNPLVAGLVGVLLFISLVRQATSGRSSPKDATRMFTASQRVEGFARAGGRCEFDTIPFIRCRRPAHHGDHWFPWSKGGSTSMTNFVAACARCNTSKGAKTPGALQTLRLQARRRRYFPMGVPVNAGERFAHR